MRRAATLFTAVFLGLAITGCDSGAVPPPGQSRDVAAPQPLASNEVLLRGEGLVAGVEAFYFAAGQREVEAALARALGEQVANGTMAECGAGAIEFASYSGGLAVHFQEGNLVGWKLGGDDQPISVTGDVQIGTSADEARAADGFTPVAETTLGEEFTLGPRIGGLIADNRVAMLYAGTQCFER